ncbi:hypothetical protein Lfu02_65150 [Longispora fulva]|nr:hypothetical protein Lfu02_65150 [Longispora fulva]
MAAVAPRSARRDSSVSGIGRSSRSAGAGPRCLTCSGIARTALSARRKTYPALPYGRVMISMLCPLGSRKWAPFAHRPNSDGPGARPGSVWRRTGRAGMMGGV